jgi:predicted ABC-type ATPase
MPNLYIIAGCNGAGKTTASYTILPEILNCLEFVNADEIAKGLSPFQPETVSFEAGRIMLERINNLLDEANDFAFETTLATRSYVSFIKKAKSKGYFVTLLYFWLSSPELAIDRVEKRVESGGHNIPDEVVLRRYERGLFNLSNLFIDVCDFCMIFDNSENSSRIIAKGSDKESMEILDVLIYNKIIRE